MMLLISNSYWGIWIKHMVSSLSFFCLLPLIVWAFNGRNQFEIFQYLETRESRRTRQFASVPRVSASPLVALVLPHPFRLSSLHCHLCWSPWYQRSALHEITSTELSIQDSTCHRQLCSLQTHTSVVADLVSRCPKEEGKLPRNVQALLADIFQKIGAPFIGDFNPLSIVIYCQKWQSSEEPKLAYFWSATNGKCATNN